MTAGLKGYSDIHYTRPEVARRVVAHFQPAGRCLDPARGQGAFHRHLPAGSDWCELSEGRDFFLYTALVDWILTNPPFEQLTDWLRHAFALALNVVFVIPLSKLFSSAPRMELLQAFGGIKEIVYLGTGRDIGFDIGFPFGAIHFLKGYTGPTTFTWWSPPYPLEASCTPR